MVERSGCGSSDLCVDSFRRGDWDLRDFALFWSASRSRRGGNSKLFLCSRALCARGGKARINVLPPAGRSALCLPSGRPHKLVPGLWLRLLRSMVGSCRSHTLRSRINVLRAPGASALCLLSSRPSGRREERRRAGGECARTKVVDHLGMLQ